MAAAYCVTKGCLLRDGHAGPCGEPGKLETARELLRQAKYLRRLSSQDPLIADFDDGLRCAAERLERRAKALTIKPTARKRTVRR
jgi:hypothetical protein